MMMGAAYILNCIKLHKAKVFDRFNKSSAPVGLVERPHAFNQSARISLLLISIMVNRSEGRWCVLPDEGQKAFVRHEFREMFLMFLR